MSLWRRCVNSHTPGTVADTQQFGFDSVSQWLSGMRTFYPWRTERWLLEIGSRMHVRHSKISAVEAALLLRAPTSSDPSQNVTLCCIAAATLLQAVVMTGDSDYA